MKGLYKATVLQDRPSLYWPMDELTGSTAFDLSGNGRDGTYVASPTLGVAGPIPGEGLAVDLNGSTQFIRNTAFDPFTAGSTVTLEVWANRDASTDADNLWASDFGSGGIPNFGIAAGAEDIDFSPDSDLGAQASWVTGWPGVAQWGHAVLVYDEAANTAECFVNGVSKGSLAVTANYQAGLGAGVAVGMAAGSAWPMNGKVAHAAIYEYALNATRIHHHYLMGRGASGLAFPAPAMGWR